MTARSADIDTYEITPELVQELRAGVAWWQAHGRPDLTAPLALREAVEDWIAALRVEHLGDREIPRPPPVLRPVDDS